jgi:hypothetical protein
MTQNEPKKEDSAVLTEEVGITLRVMSGPVITPELLVAFAEKSAAAGQGPADRLAMLIREDIKIPA